MATFPNGGRQKESRGLARGQGGGSSSVIKSWCPRNAQTCSEIDTLETSAAASSVCCIHEVVVTKSYPINTRFNNVNCIA